MDTFLQVIGAITLGIGVLAALWFLFSVLVHSAVDMPSSDRIDSLDRYIDHTLERVRALEERNREEDARKNKRVR